MFVRQTVLNLCELVTSENEDLPTLEDVPLVKLGRFPGITHRSSNQWCQTMKIELENGAKIAPYVERKSKAG